jgi:hypothetical protein
MNLSHEKSHATTRRHFLAIRRAKHVIYLHMVGSPPQQDLFDYKPVLNQYHLKECPKEMLEGRKFAFIKGVPKLLGSFQKFRQHGRGGASDLLPNIASVSDDLCLIKSMRTDQFNHAPAQLMVHTGSPRLGGGASLGAWVVYGLGTENQNLPGFIVLVSAAAKSPTAANRSGDPASCPASIRACSAGPRATRCSISPIRRRHRDDPASTSIRYARRRGQPPAARRDRRPRDPDAHVAVRDGLPHADERQRRHGHVQGGPDTHERYGTQPGKASFRQQLPARAPPRRVAACASSSSSTGAGTSTAPAVGDDRSPTDSRSAARWTVRSPR